METITAIENARNVYRRLISDLRLAEIDHILDPSPARRQVCVQLYRKALDAETVYHEARRLTAPAVIPAPRTPTL